MAALEKDRQGVTFKDKQSIESLELWVFHAASPLPQHPHRERRKLLQVTP